MQYFFKYLSQYIQRSTCVQWNRPLAEGGRGGGPEHCNNIFFHNAKMFTLWQNNACLIRIHIYIYSIYTYPMGTVIFSQMFTELNFPVSSPLGITLLGWWKTRLYFSHVEKTSCADEQCINYRSTWIFTHVTFPPLETNILNPKMEF